MKKTAFEDVRAMLPAIHPQSDKYGRGYLVTIAGSYGMAGACVLSSRAALRAGVGYLRIVLPKEIYPIVAGAVPEAVFSIFDPDVPENLSETVSKVLRKRPDAVLFGCGTGTLREELLTSVLRDVASPLLIDADGLNALAGWEGAMPELPDLVLTPHEGELSRLLQVSREEVHEAREEMLSAAIKKFCGTVLLKGPETLIGAPRKETIMNPHIEPALSRAGSGDVLAGIISSLMAQGMGGYEAAAAGAFIHGECGRLARKKLGVRSVLPSDLIEMIPEVFNALDAPETSGAEL